MKVEFNAETGEIILLHETDFELSVLSNLRAKDTDVYGGTLWLSEYRYDPKDNMRYQGLFFKMVGRKSDLQAERPEGG